MTYEEENRNQNQPQAGRRPAERLNTPGRGENEDERQDFQDHLEKRADGGRSQDPSQGSGLIDRERFEARLEGIADEKRARVLSTAEDLVHVSDQPPEPAVLNAMREETRDGPSFTREEKVSPNVSLEHPHGPEGASHGGRTGRDPLQYVEDSTPSGTNAFSSTRDSPAESRRKRGA